VFTVCMNSTIIRLFASETDAPNCAESRTSVMGNHEYSVLNWAASGKILPV
jgi:hypothetical protein